MVNNRVQRVFNRAVEDIKNKKKPVISAIMREEGYSASSAHSLTATKTATWEYLLAQISDDVVLSRVYRILAGNDARASLQAAEMLFKLKDKFPAGKLRIQAYNEEIERLKDDTV